jgi:hypothetical protein
VVFLACGSVAARGSTPALGDRGMQDALIEHLTEAGRALRRPITTRDQEPTASDPHFIAAAHDGWKALHLNAIGEIITIDTVEEKHRERPIDGRFVQYLSHIRQAWRKINDGIVWQLCGGHRHLVKRLCFYRNRGHLAAANPDAALRAIETVNRQPMAIALWNDATTCVDVGDIMKYDASSGELCFIELKSGRVNAAIIDLVSKPPTDHTFAQLDALAETYGERAIAQLERVLRQEERNSQAIRLMREEKGLDPHLGRKIEIHELKTPGEDYDDELGGVVRDATENGEGLTIIDDCLWIFVDATPGLTLRKVQQRFRDAVTRENSSLAASISRAFAVRDAGRAVLLGHALYHPMAKPPFLRRLDAETVAAITCGSLRAQVWLYLDWHGFSRLCESAGARFSWSSERQAGANRTQPAAMRLETVDGRMPVITAGEVQSGVTGANMVELMFDGLRPRSLAARMVESSRVLEAIARGRHVTSKVGRAP